MTTAACPKCHDEVTVPPGAPRVARVRCPWCREQFELAEVLDRLPPMLEIVSAPGAAKEATEDLGGFEASPEQEFRLQESSEPEARGPSFDFSGNGPATATAAAPSVAARPRTAKPTTSARPRRKEKSALAEIVKVVLGGVVGLVLAQLILWWLPGEWSRDPFEMGPKVSKYVPLIVPKVWHGQPESAGGASGENPSRNSDSAGSSQLAGGSKARPSRNTSGGTAGNAGSSGSGMRSGALGGGGLGGSGQPEPSGAPAGKENSPPDLTLSPQLGENEPLTTTENAAPDKLPGNPLAISDPDLPDLTVDLVPSTASTKTQTPGEATPANPPAPAVEVATPADNATPPAANATPSVPAEPANTPEPSAADAFVGVKDAPMYVVDEIAQSLVEAQAAQKVHEADPANEDAGKAFYVALTDLAEKLTYADANDPKIAELAQQAGDLVAKGNLRENVLLISAHAATLLGAKKQDRPNPGIVLVGKVEALEKEGDLHVMRLKLPSNVSAGVIPVFSKSEPQHKPGETLFVFGTLVDEPAKRLSGYSGGLPSVVWLGQSAAPAR